MYDVLVTQLEKGLHETSESRELKDDGVASWDEKKMKKMV